MDNYQFHTRGTTYLVIGKVFYTIKHEEDGKTSLFCIRNLDKLCNLTHTHYRLTQLMCANGLFCLWSKSMQLVAICNPFTRKIKFLPRLQDQVFDLNIFYLMYYCSLAFDPEEKKFKVWISIPYETMSRN